MAGMADRLLVLGPLFLILGCIVMKGTSIQYDIWQERIRELSEEGKYLSASGTVTALVQKEDGGCFELKNAVLYVNAEDGTKKRREKVGKLLVYAQDEAFQRIKAGQKVKIYGKAGAFEPAANPGQFSAKDYYFSKNITGNFQAEILRIQNASYSVPAQAMFSLKGKVRESFLSALSEKEAGIVSAMLLGERSGLSEDTEELYRNGGISHILAISGLHVSILGVLVLNLLRKTVLGRNGAIVVSAVVVFLYGNFVNAGISTKRAILMYFLMLLAMWTGRTYDSLSALAVSGIVILTAEPGALYTASFQLSYGAAFGASVFAGEILGKSNSAAKKTQGQTEVNNGPAAIIAQGIKKARESLLFCAAVTLFTMPLTLYHFFEFPLFGVLINPIILPLMTLLLLAAIFTGIVGLFCPVAGVFFGGTVHTILCLYEEVCSLTQGLPFSVLSVGKPSVTCVATVYVIFFIWVAILRKEREKQKKERAKGEREVFFWKKKALLAGGVSILLLLPRITGGGSEVSVTFLSVGQGDATVIHSDTGHVFLIDGGSTDIGKVGCNRLIPYLKAAGVRNLDAVFISHDDADHRNGVEEILEQMPPNTAYGLSPAGYRGKIRIRCIYLPKIPPSGDMSGKNRFEKICRLAKEKNVDIRYICADDGIEDGKNLQIVCRSPKKGNEYKDENCASMVLDVRYRNMRVFMTGDISKEEENGMLDVAAENSDSSGKTVTVLKVAHHGSATSSDRKFLKVLSPDVAVISCGKNNRYGHPHTETLDLLASLNVAVVRTDLEGAVRLRWKHGKVYMQTFFGAGGWR